MRAQKEAETLAPASPWHKFLAVKMAGGYHKQS